MGYARRVLLKRAVGRILQASGATTLGRRLARGRALVLTYHGVLPAGPDSYVSRQSVDARMFDAQLAWLTRTYHVLPLGTIVDALASGSPLPPSSVAITFDDGLRNVLTDALPILRAHRATATLFLCTGPVDRNGLLWTDEVNRLVMNARVSSMCWRFGGSEQRLRLSTVPQRERAAHTVRTGMKRLTPVDRDAALDALRRSVGEGAALDAAAHPDAAFLSWDDVRALAANGVEIGAHGVSHTVLTALDEDRARHEIVASRQAIEAQVAQPCTLFAYPNGARGDLLAVHKRLLADLGFRAAVTQIEGFNTAATDRFELRRINVSRVHSLAYFKAEVSRAAGLLYELPGRAAALVRSARA
jgi:peptidoglycan/xylan/chitin deacetylase (PgdA/CDA1 family)